MNVIGTARKNIRPPLRQRSWKAHIQHSGPDSWADQVRGKQGMQRPHKAVMTKHPTTSLRKHTKADVWISQIREISQRNTMGNKQPAYRLYRRGMILESSE
jgi:hypothetical protein